MKNIQAWLFLASKRTLYYFFALILLFIGTWFSLTGDNVAIIVLGCCAAVTSAYFYQLGKDLAEPLSHESRFDFSKYINIGQGTYNESINVDGDYVKGNKNIFNNFNFKQEPSDILSDLEATLGKLKSRFDNLEDASQKIIDDLVAISKGNAEIKEKLYSVASSIDPRRLLDDTNIVEVAEILARAVSHADSASVLNASPDMKFKRLQYLLKTAQWKKADAETERIIEKIMPKKAPFYRCKEIYVDQISRKSLLTINELWLRASGGRFGFSVQQKIWKRVLKKSEIKRFIHNKDSKYDIFVNAVGWSNEKGRIYHVDFDDSIANPKGFFPVKILLRETYRPDSNYCYLSACIFDELMDRDYSLREWLKTRNWMSEIFRRSSG